MAAKNVIIIVVYSPVFCRWFYFPCCAIVLPQFRTVASAALGADGHEAGRIPGAAAVPAGREGWPSLAPGRRWRPGTIPGAGVVSAHVLGSRILLPSAGNKQY